MPKAYSDLKEIRKCGSPTISYIEYLNLGDERWESVTSVL